MSDLPYVFESAMQRYEERMRKKDIPMERVLKTNNPYYTSYRLLRQPSPFSRFMNGEAYSFPLQYREQMVQQFAWAIPNPQAIKALANLSPIIEIGAGNGYWANLINGCGGDIVCYDKHPYQHAFYNGGIAGAGIKNWFHVMQHNESAVYLHPDRRTLFLCWPPYKDAMAWNALRYFKGETVAYVGEQGGCTGDDQFHDLLDGDWYTHTIIQIPQFEGIHDSLFIYKRKNALENIVYRAVK